MPSVDLLGNPQIITYLGLYAVRIFDAAEEGLYVPSYFLSAYPDTVQGVAYGEVVLWRGGEPLLMYIRTATAASYAMNEKKRLLIDALRRHKKIRKIFRTGLLNFLPPGEDKYVHFQYNTVALYMATRK
jgi:hypothetical protein